MREHNIEAKKERNRQTVKRFYHRKLSLLRGLRDEANRLNQEYQVLMQQLYEQFEGHTNKDVGKPTSFTASLYRRYRDACQVVERLSQENQALRSTITARTKTSRKLQRIVDSKCEGLLNVATREHVMRLQRLCSCPLDFHQPETLTKELCDDLLDATQSQVHAILAASPPLSPVISLLGWSYYHARTQHNAFEFAATRVYPSHAPELLAHRSWQTLTSPAFYTGPLLGLRGLDSHGHVVQVIDAQNAVMCVSTPTPKTLYHFFFIVSRRALTPQKHAVVCRSLSTCQVQRMNVDSTPLPFSTAVQAKFAMWCTISTERARPGECTVTMEGFLPCFGRDEHSDQACCSSRDSIVDLTSLLARLEMDVVHGREEKQPFWGDL